MNFNKLNNKPKYQFIKNFSYALSGLKDLILNEVSFRLELFFFFFMSIFIPYLNETFNHKLILFLSLFLPIFSEIVNSAIERIVDLITLEYSEQAKRSKDVGSTLVLFSFFLVFLIWGFILYY